MTHLPPLWLAFTFNELEQPEEVVMVKYLDMSHLSLSKRQMVIEKTKAIVVKEGIFHGEYHQRHEDMTSRADIVVISFCTGLSVGKGAQFKSSSMSIPKYNN